MVAIWNIEGADMIDGSRSDGAFVRSSSKLTTACVVARFPAESRVMIRSPGFSQWRILRTCETSSTPALVRVSDMKIRPRSNRMPTQ